MLVTVFAEVLSKMAAMWRRKEDHVSGNFLCRYVQNYLLLPVIFIETRKIQLFLSSESIRGKESDLVEPDNSLLSGFLRQWHDLAARALKILLKIVWPLAPQSVKRLIDHLKWKKYIYVNSALNIIVSLHLSAPAAEEAKLKTVVSRSGFYKIWELQGAIFALRISHCSRQSFPKVNQWGSSSSKCLPITSMEISKSSKCFQISSREAIGKEVNWKWHALAEKRKIYIFSQVSLIMTFIGNCSKRIHSLVYISSRYMTCVGCTLFKSLLWRVISGMKSPSPQHKLFPQQITYFPEYIYFTKIGYFKPLFTAYFSSQD